MAKPEDSVDIIDPVTTPAYEERKFPVFQQLFLLLLVLGLVFGGAYVPQLLRDVSDEQTATPIKPLPPIENVEAISELPELPIQARMAYVWDVREQRALYSKNPDDVWPLASITKLMTALVAYELIESEKDVALSLEAIRQDGNSGLIDGERFSLSTLSDFALVTSSNDAAYAMAQTAGALLSNGNHTEAFVAGMNIRADELGLMNTNFRNPTGLDVNETEAGAMGTARDVTFLMEYILKEHPEILEATQKTYDRVYNQDGAYHGSENTNALAADIPNLIGSKTGYTDLAGGNLVVAYDTGLNRPIIVTVLGSSRNGRFQDVKTIIDAVSDGYSLKE
ncbi:MAG: serine hydrolase [Patescibacteria group bacterium]